MRYWCQDESRFGLKTIVGRLITLCGVKPQGYVSWQRDNFYVYGLVEPLTGEHFFWEFSHLDTVCFQTFIDLFAQHHRDTFNIIQLDNGAFHTTDALVWPSNVILLAQPPYSPQLNPIERLWEYLKQQLEWQSFETLEHLMVKVESLLEGLSTQLITSLCGWEFITEAVLSAST
jgi:transposase